VTLPYRLVTIRIQCFVQEQLPLHYSTHTCFRSLKTGKVLPIARGHDGILNAVKVEHRQTVADLMHKPLVWSCSIHSRASASSFRQLEGNRDTVSVASPLFANQAKFVTRSFGSLEVVYTVSFPLAGSLLSRYRCYRCHFLVNRFARVASLHYVALRAFVSDQMYYLRSFIECH
jgi:hypothetical protein